jgi:carbamoyl-phosphate synthase large subunit
MMQPRFSKIVVLGSSALKIGEAGEFDYSGSQALKAFRQERIQTVLINPNIATNQTSEQLADKVYFLPIQPYFVEEVIRRERPDAIALSFGGQTALNCGLELARRSVLERHGVAVAGTPVRAIEITEDRQLFARRLEELGVSIPRSVAVNAMSEVAAAGQAIGYPVLVRAGFALGGFGSGVCYDEAQLLARAERNFANVPQILIEEYLAGWKEIEYEVVRDRYDNCLTVCNMENFDPLGIHTGESIVVAPSQTLTNAEYHGLREAAIRIIRALGVIGECNIQFAVNPRNGEYRVIEVNARLSRSSALASKATAYPLAFIAAKLAVGYGLPELTNQVTRTTACFEPALDYIVVKVPRWDLKKFRRVATRIGTGMKSVGEVMAIGRKFEEALQKALRMLEIGVDGFAGSHPFRFADLDEELRHPTDKRVFAVAAALAAGYSVERIHDLTHIDPWFLEKLANLRRMETQLRTYHGGPCPPGLLREAKELGFSDNQVGTCLKLAAGQVRTMRQNHDIRPVIKQIDTVAAEYPAQTNFLYLTYNGTTSDVTPAGANAVMILGSGVYRIGSSVEFDWCCVSAARTLRELGYQTILVNNNPETVSTDYDECDRLYFDELSFETIAEIYAHEAPHGMVLAMGGQTPNNLAVALDQAGLRILGTRADMIDRAEDRRRFSGLLDQLGLRQPLWRELRSPADAEQFADEVGYPVLVRPSYVLSGQAMGVAGTPDDLRRFLTEAASISGEKRVVISKFIENAREFEFDGVGLRGAILAGAISEHIENAGVHSGDATLVFPPQEASIDTIRRIQRSARQIAQALEITGPFNIQFIVRDGDVLIIECNLRASRSFPFVSKVYRVNFIDLATRAMAGAPVQPVTRSYLDLEYVGVKAPQFSFPRLDGADPVLGVEMSSTGEVGCLGDDLDEALLKAMLSVGYRMPVRSVLLSTGPLDTKAEFIPSARKLAAAGVQLYATDGTAQFMRQFGLEPQVLHWPLEAKSPNVLEYLSQGRIDLVINVPKSWEAEELRNDYLIRRRAVDYNIPLITDLNLARRFTSALVCKRIEQLAIKSWDEYGGIKQPDAAASQARLRLVG